MKPMRSVTIRPARTQDLDSLLRFEQGVIDAERPFDATLADGPVRYYDIGAMLLRDDVRFLVAEAESRLIGCGYARIVTAEPYLKHPRQGYLGLMYVDTAYRGDSVVGRIIEELKHWCRAQEVLELRLEVYEGNRAAIRAYEKAGFSPHMLEMRLGLDP
jgi:ribosomal protein S18 acetylase RimI-like enzyme